jgi:hypothetical protein
LTGDSDYASAGQIKGDLENLHVNSLTVDEAYELAGGWSRF